MKATLLAIASARSKAIRCAQNVAKTSPAAMYPSASVNMVCCIEVASCGPANLPSGRQGRELTRCSRSRTNFSFFDHRMGLALRVTEIVLDGTDEAALRSLFKDLKIGTTHISA